MNARIRNIISIPLIYLLTISSSYAAGKLSDNDSTIVNVNSKRSVVTDSLIILQVSVSIDKWSEMGENGVE